MGVTESPRFGRDWGKNSIGVIDKKTFTCLGVNEIVERKNKPVDAKHTKTLSLSQTKNQTKILPERKEVEKGPKEFFLIADMTEERENSYSLGQFYS